MMIPCTPEEYYKHTTKVIPVSNGLNFEIQAMGAEAAVYFYTIVPEEGVEGNEKAVSGFLLKNFIGLRDNVIVPCIVAPKLEPSRIIFADLSLLLFEIMKLSGMMPEGETVSPTPAEDPSAT